MSKRTWIVAGVLAAIAVSALVWVLLRPQQVEVVVVEQTALVRTVQFSARVASLSRVEIGSTLTGRVQSVLVREGQMVAAGEALVEMDTEELRAALAQAEASERQARARLQGTSTTARQSAQAALAQAAAGARAAEAEWNRVQALVRQGFLSEARLDEARRAAEIARAQVDGARAQTAALGDTGSESRQAVAQLDTAAATTALARARLALATIRAPSAGHVLDRAVEPGQIVQPGRVLMQMSIAGAPQLVAPVDERYLGQLAVGQAAHVVADAYPGQAFQARVLSIAPHVDPARGTVEVKFSLVPPAPDFLREDLTLSVEVETARRDRALVVPAAALRGVSNTQGPAELAVVADGRLVLREVRTGLRTLDAIEIVEGLRAGDQVALDGRLPIGKSVRPNAKAWAPARSSRTQPGRDDADLTSTVTR